MKQNTALSVNVNKIATIRNARGGNLPNLIRVAQDCEKFGADGITVHPRPDERHIRYRDVYDLKKALTKEFNIEGNPNKKWMDLVLDVVPTQATLVPDKPEAITSNAGYDLQKEGDRLRPIIEKLKNKGIRVSIFINPDVSMVPLAKEIGADRIELFTGPYADEFSKGNREEAILEYVNCSKEAHSCGLGINAGHDLSLENLKYFVCNLPFIDEVSIGHALISDALYFGLGRTIEEYKVQFQC